MELLVVTVSEVWSDVTNKIVGMVGVGSYQTSRRTELITGHNYKHRKKKHYRPKTKGKQKKKLFYWSHG